MNQKILDLYSDYLLSSFGQTTATGLSTLYYGQGTALPVAFELVSKTETYIDKKTGWEKRKCKVTKNERYCRMLQAVCHNQVPFAHVLNDLWFASAEKMRFVKLDLEKAFIMALKSNRKVALSEADKANGLYQRIDQLEIPEGTTLTIYLEGFHFPYSYQ